MTLDFLEILFQAGAIIRKASIFYQLRDTKWKKEP